MRRTKFQNPIVVRKEFKSWLERNEFKLFKRASESACPIAKYLNDIAEEDGAFVGMNEYHTEGHSSNALPKWAETFVAIVDEGSGFIDSEESIAILNRIP